MKSNQNLQWTSRLRNRTGNQTENRRGAIVVLLVLLLPALLILCAVAINLAKVELTRTELQIATDVATRAGGTAWTATGDLNQAIEKAELAASLNTVQKKPLILAPSDIIFGNSLRPEDRGRYVFEALDPQPNPDDIDQAAADGSLITSVQVVGNANAGLYFEIAGVKSIAQITNSVTSQVDRDIALVVDRSGSMAYFENEQFLYNEITRLYNRGDNDFGITPRDYIDAVNDFQGPTHTDTTGLGPGEQPAVPEDVPTVNIADTMSEAGFPRSRRNLPSLSLNNRFYEDSVIAGLDSKISSETDFETREKLSDLLDYAETLNNDYNPNGNQNGRSAAPDESRWNVLAQAMGAFTNVLDESRLQERVSVTSFSSGNDVSLDLATTSDLNLAQSTVLDLIPSGSTAIGEGMNEAVRHLIDTRRVNAVPTMLIFSDGDNRQGRSPIEIVTEIKNKYPSVVVNTVTFADGDQAEMRKVAELGSGKHFHANDGDQLIEVFETIARSFSTVITE